ncbi:hypothetical protein L1887_59310 [Cichorium endivia]|nr:hypothetical protein L1887_59310 [Cichorium endivia]
MLATRRRRCCPARSAYRQSLLQPFQRSRHLRERLFWRDDQIFEAPVTPSNATMSVAQCRGDAMAVGGGFVRAGFNVLGRIWLSPHEKKKNYAHEKGNGQTCRERCADCDDGKSHWGAS